LAVSHHFAGERIDSILSRLVVIVWVFVLLVITSSYTANLSSILTVQQLQPTVTDVHELIREGEYVGYHNGSYVGNLLEVLGFDRTKIRAYKTSEDFAMHSLKGAKMVVLLLSYMKFPTSSYFLQSIAKVTQWLDQFTNPKALAL
jgi:glutamate receptor, ionotropic, plant